jgi:catechol 2,3-dioxygenase-like lactoylglutathione lyase family enzyme
LADRKIREVIPAALPYAESTIQRFSHVGILVFDQHAARDFYVNKLGFEVRMDQTMDNGYRWLTVSPKGQPDLQIILPKVDGPNMKPEVAATLKSLMEKTGLSGGVLQVDDCRTTYEELRAKGVEFLSPPADRFYGVECILKDNKDNSNNWFSMTQPKALLPM